MHPAQGSSTGEKCIVCAKGQVRGRKRFVTSRFRIFHDFFPTARLRESAIKLTAPKSK
jgi:hypothetical protein